MSGRSAKALLHADSRSPRPASPCVQTPPPGRRLETVRDYARELGTAEGKLSLALSTLKFFRAGLAESRSIEIQPGAKMLLAKVDSRIRFIEAPLPSPLELPPVRVSVLEDPPLPAGDASSFWTRVLPRPKSECLDVGGVLRSAHDLILDRRCFLPGVSPMAVDASGGLVVAESTRAAAWSGFGALDRICTLHADEKIFREAYRLLGAVVQLDWFDWLCESAASVRAGPKEDRGHGDVLAAFAHAFVRSQHPSSSLLAAPERQAVPSHRVGRCRSPGRSVSIPRPPFKSGDVHCQSQLQSRLRQILHWLTRNPKAARAGTTARKPRVRLPPPAIEGRRG